ncbi:UNKNOWN [Stylonychia lemnae]|uniref:Mitochondrial carrier protein n=1 Tax=Stylonychia lemnae TaxID=5949 RepID=A0A078B885_STYLE|nr:UNKNOWN [Stylonychia lemnae]|eukprot:CDW89502.1 UNKNOWN [Stylonychia lemnae]
MDKKHIESEKKEQQVMGDDLTQKDGANQKSDEVTEEVKVVAQIQINNDYSLPIYPIHVLSTNRILDTIISRNEVNKPASNMYKLRGIGAYFAGFVPYSINFFFNNVEFQYKADEEVNHPLANYYLISTIALWNPINIMIVRMQCLDYPIRKFRGALWDMIKHDKHRMLYSGIAPIFAGQAYLYCAIIAAESMTSFGYKYAPEVSLGLFLTSCLFAHPLFLIGMRVQYGRFHATQIQREAYKNWFNALVYIKNQQGSRAFYKGFAPAMFIYTAMHYESLRSFILDPLKQKYLGWAQKQ